MQKKKRLASKRVEASRYPSSEMMLALSWGSRKASCSIIICGCRKRYVCWLAQLPHESGINRYIALGYKGACARARADDYLAHKGRREGRLIVGEFEAKPLDRSGLAEHLTGETS